MPKSLRVLVTGATGLAGSHTVRALLDAGHQVRALVRSPEKAHRVFAGQAGPLESVQGDIGDVASVQSALRGCDGVLHCAATVAVGHTDRPEALVESNVAGARNVVGSAVEAGIERIVHVSSLATLFRGDGTPISESSEPQDSPHPYGRSKTIAEHYVRDLQAEGHPVKIVYPGTIIAPDDPGLTESMDAVRTFIQDFTPLTSGGIQFIDARDLAAAHVRMLEAEPGPRRYIVGGTFLRWPEVATILESTTGKRPRTFRIPAPLLQVMGRTLDLLRKVIHVELPLSAEAATYVTKWHAIPNSRALGEMGVHLRDIDETMQDTVDWLREAGHLQG
jgi:dihydroflavonol-4-reductase